MLLLVVVVVVFVLFFLFMGVGRGGGLTAGLSAKVLNGRTTYVVIPRAQYM